MAWPTQNSRSVETPFSGPGILLGGSLVRHQFWSLMLLCLLLMPVLAHIHVVVSVNSLSLHQLFLFLFLLFATAALGLEVFAAGVRGSVFLLGSRCIDIHLHVFTLGLAVLSFNSYFLLLVFLLGAVCRFVVSSYISLGLVWGEFGRCGGFRVPKADVSMIRLFCEERERQSK